MQRCIFLEIAKNKGLILKEGNTPSNLKSICPTRSKRSLEKKEEPVPSPSLSGLQRTPKAEHPSRKRTVSQSSTSLSSGTGSGKEGNHSTKSNSTSKHRKGDDKGRSTRDGKVGVSNLYECVCLPGRHCGHKREFTHSSYLPTVQTLPLGMNCASTKLSEIEWNNQWIKGARKNWLKKMFV